MNNSKRIFISYSRRDESFARHLATDLDNLGADVWIDTDDIPPGMNWSNAIQQGLDLCDVMILIITPDSMASRNVENEWQYFWDLGKPIIPILWLPAKVHFQIHRLQYINFQAQSYPVALRQLRKVLRQQGIALGTGPDDSVNLPRQELLPVRTDTSPAPARRPYRQYGAIGAALAVLVAAALIVLALNSVLGGDGDKKATSTQPGAVAQEPPATTEPTLTTTPEPPATTEPTLTTTPEPPAAPTLTETPGDNRPASVTPLPIETQIWLDITATRQAANDFASATAAQWTPTPTFTPTPTHTLTPTPNATETYAAMMVAAIQTLTATMWTPTPTNTFTPTSTPTWTYTPTATITPTSLPAGASNRAWTPTGQDVDGVTMVYVPAGCFNMGSNDGDEDEQPVHEVCLDAFWIDKTEVTNGQYGSSGSFFGDQRPRENVTWSEAQQFCQSRGARLPTEAEWEYTARGPEGWTYPWGNEWDASKATWNRFISEGTAPVGSLPDGVSWVGALDMSGNVWEWVADWYGTYPSGQQVNPAGPGSGTGRVLRGGAWSLNNTAYLRAADRNWYDPTYHYDYVGFRCARSAEGSASQAVPTVQAAIPTSIPAGSSNRAWTPVEQNADGVTMVYVPAGCFRMGSNDGDEDEQPVHEVCLDAFWIDQTEVTNGQFASLNGQAEFESNWTENNRPREHVTWFEARTFCESRGARLPTEAEWEYAARGPEGWTYPWGNEWDASKTVWNRSRSEGTAPVGSLLSGAAWVGALDMSGNVWEWVADWYAETYPAVRQVNPAGPTSGTMRVRRGGSWSATITSYLRAAYRYGLSPTHHYNLIGFRCARSAEGPASQAVPTTQAAAPTSIPAGSSNPAWTPTGQDVDGVTMVYVPAGCFNMGSNDGSDDEQPVHEVCLDAFWIDQTEVTNGQYGSSGSFFGDQRPRENVTWTEAQQHCENRGARLPTEAEWEYAARGPEDWTYPWGSEWDPSKGIWNRSSSEGTASVGSLPDGVSWVGALDMSGNVWEWVADWYGTYPSGQQVNPAGPDSGTARVLRGGAWSNYDTALLRAADRFRFNPTNYGSYVGFRCALDAE